MKHIPKLFLFSIVVFYNCNTAINNGSAHNTYNDNINNSFWRYSLPIILAHTTENTDSISLPPVSIKFYEGPSYKNKIIEKEYSGKDFNASITLISSSFMNGIIHSIYNENNSNNPKILEYINSVNKFSHQYFTSENRKHRIYQNIDIFDDAFSKAFGVSLINSITFTKIGPLYHYNINALLKAFNHLYVKPDQNILIFKAQDFYNIVFKEYFKLNVPIIFKLYHDKKYLNGISKEYIEFANTTGNSHNIINFVFNHYSQYRVNMGYQKPSHPYEDIYDDRLFGTIIRRNIDGTLQTCIDLLKKVIHDYDPLLYNECN